MGPRWSVGCGLNMEMMLQGTETKCRLPCEASPTRPCMVAPLCRDGHVSLHAVRVSIHCNSFIYILE